MSASLFPSHPQRLISMRELSLAASTTTLTAAAALLPVVMAGAGGWIGATLCGLGVLALTKLRDSNIEADVRSEMALQERRERPIAPTLPASLRNKPEPSPARGRMRVVAVPSATCSDHRGVVPALVERWNTETPNEGRPVSFKLHDWDRGDVTYHGIVEKLAPNGFVRVRCDHGQVVLVHVSALELNATGRRPS